MDPKIKAARITLGGFFKDRREEMGRSQQELAVFLGITVNTLQKIESGRFAWDIDLQHQLCAALEIKPYFSASKRPGVEDTESSDLLRVWLDQRPAITLKELAKQAGIPYMAFYDLQRGIDLPQKHWPALIPVLEKYGWE